MTVVATEKPTPIRDVAPHVPHGLAQIVMKAIAMDAADRFQVPAALDAAIGARTKPCPSVDSSPALSWAHNVLPGTRLAHAELAVCAVPTCWRTEHAIEVHHGTADTASFPGRRSLVSHCSRARCGRPSEARLSPLSWTVDITWAAAVIDHLGPAPTRAERRGTGGAQFRLDGSCPRALRAACRPDNASGDRSYLVLAKPNVIMNDIRLRGLAVGGSEAAGRKSPHNHAQTVRNLKRYLRNAAAGRLVQADGLDSKSAADLATSLEDALAELHRLERRLDRRILRDQIRYGRTRGSTQFPNRLHPGYSSLPAAAPRILTAACRSCRGTVVSDAPGGSHLRGDSAHAHIARRRRWTSTLSNCGTLQPEVCVLFPVPSLDRVAQVPCLGPLCG
jgi:hypothetical protein